MDAFRAIFELIDMRSFSSLWFWILLAVTWSTASHWVIGVPYDLIQRARRTGPEAWHDLDTLIQIYTGRILYISREAGLVLIGLLFFALTMFALLGFWYGQEFSQALFLLVTPLCIVGLLSVRTASRIERHNLRSPDLFPVLRWHRFWVQVIGMISIFVTAMWGMLQNLTIGPLAG